MSTRLKNLAIGATIAAALAAVPGLHAQDYPSLSHGSKLGRDMMGEGGMMAMMGSMMSGMMGMSGDMGGMMDHCNAMMQGTDGQRPNDQWRTPQPEQPDRSRG
jgi:hypothetical protein